MADSTPDPAAEEIATVQATKPVDGSAPKPQAATEGEFDPSKLPSYKRNLLKIRVPVTVALASQRTTIQEIIELGPGSIVKFAKTCDEPLELTVGERTIATGEVVKVGDKFGLKIGRLVTSG